MVFKKNALSYFVWIIFTMFNVAVFSFGGMLLANALGGPLVFAAIGTVVGFYGVLLLVSLLIIGLVKKASLKKTEKKAGQVKKRLVLEGIFSVCILAGGIVLRICWLPRAGESAAYFDVAKVTQDNVSMLVPVQNSVYYYLGLLRGLFLLVGNQWIAGIWLQIILQICSCIVLYFAVRKMAGAWAAMISLAYLMFVPSSVELSLNYGPDVFYFLLWSFGLLTVSSLLSSEKEGDEKTGIWHSLRMWLASLLVGLLLGFLAYVDVFGAVLVLPLIFLPAVYRWSKRRWVWGIRAIAALLFAAGSFFGVIALDGVLSNVGFERVMYAWLKTFQPEFPNIYMLLQGNIVEVIILLVFMSFNIFSFIGSKQQDRSTIWILMMFSSLALYIFGVTTSSMDGRNILMVLMCISGIVGFRELFRVPAQDMEPVAEEVKAVMTKEETAAFYEDFKLPTENKNQPIMDIEYIENPLPLPKKHVKKTMDYAIVPQDMYMKYDIEVPDTDDFDV